MFEMLLLKFPIGAISFIAGEQPGAEFDSHGPE
jgi:hypothetical protein